MHVLNPSMPGTSPGMTKTFQKSEDIIMTTITLGGRRFALRPLTLGQLRSVLPAFARAAGLANEEAIDAAIDIIAAALERDHPAFDRDALLGIEMRPAELIAAVDTIARLSGLVAEEPGPLGQAQALGEERASPGASFTAS
jgi:hypothetical protein